MTLCDFIIISAMSIPIIIIISGSLSPSRSWRSWNA